MKKGKLTPTELACIKGMVAEDISVEAMCAQLDRSDILIEKAVNRIKSDAVRQQLYINTTAAGTKGVSIMTERASVAGDNPKTSPSPPEKSSRSSCIHTIRSDG